MIDYTKIQLLIIEYMKNIIEKMYILYEKSYK